MSENNIAEKEVKFIIKPEFKGKTFKLAQLKEPGFMDKIFKNAGEYLETK